MNPFKIIILISITIYCFDYINNKDEIKIKIIELYNILNEYLLNTLPDFNIVLLLFIISFILLIL